MNSQSVRYICTRYQFVLFCSILPSYSVYILLKKCLTLSARATSISTASGPKEFGFLEYPVTLYVIGIVFQLVPVKSNYSFITRMTLLGNNKVAFSVFKIGFSMLNFKSIA